MLSFHPSGLPFHPIPPPSCPSGMSCHTGSGSPQAGLLLAFIIIAASVIFVLLVIFIIYTREQRRGRAAARTMFEQEQARLDESLRAAEKTLSTANPESNEYRRAERKKKRIQEEIAHLRQSIEQQGPRVS